MWKDIDFGVYFFFYLYVKYMFSFFKGDMVINMIMICKRCCGGGEKKEMLFKCEIKIDICIIFEIR